MGKGASAPFPFIITWHIVCNKQVWCHCPMSPSLNGGNAKDMKAFLIIAGIIVALYCLLVATGYNAAQIQFSALAVLGVVIGLALHFWWVLAILLVLYLIFRK